MGPSSRKEEFTAPMGHLNNKLRSLQKHFIKASVR